VDFSSRRLIAILLKKAGKAIKKHTNPEQWFLEQLDAYTQKQASVEKTPDCCEDSFLRAYARKPGSFSLSDARVEHVMTCNYCLPRLLQMRAARRAVRPLHERVAAAIALGVACLLVGFVVATYWNHSRPSILPGPSASIQRTMSFTERSLDLTDYGTYRGAGDTPTKPPLLLPAALLHVNLILPRFSEPGRYQIMVAQDRNGKNGLASASGTAASNGSRTTVDVALDLRGTKPGDYWLLTRLNTDDDFYSYPLKIQ
jgi:hypothetical protein